MILRCSRRLLIGFKQAVAAVRAQPPQIPTTRYYSSVLRHVTEPAASVCRSPTWQPLPGRSQPIDSRRWYHNSLKIASVAALVSGATAIAVYRPYIELEVVPYTNRTHVVFLSPQSEREVLGSRLDGDRKKWAAQSWIVDPLHPDSVRLRLIAEKIIRAAHCTLGIHGPDIAMLHGGSSVKDDKTRRKASPMQPHAAHLRDLEWEVILVKGEQGNAMVTPAGKVVVFTGLLDILKTDAEIAFVLAHEVGHIIARHRAEIAYHDWFPILLWLPLHRKMEIEADHIGMMLLGAAGFHPYTTLIVLWKLAKADTQTRWQSFLSPHPSFTKRSKYVLQPKVIKKAMELYKEATPGQDAHNKSVR